MNAMKKVLALMLAAVMVMTISITVFADEPDQTTEPTEGTGSIESEAATYEGKITIQTISGQNYTLYKLFEAAVKEGRKDGEAGISYTLRSDKADLGADGSTWFKLENNNVVANGDSVDVSTAAFRTWAKSYGQATGESITGDGTAKTWSGLTPGYYFITTTTGSLVTVTSITPDVTVTDKNSVPDLDKNIKTVTDDDGATAHSVADDGETAHAEIGDTVEYEVKLNGYQGAANYIFEDTLSAGLTLGAKTDLTITGTKPDRTLVEDTDYTVNTFGANTAGGSIKITFTKTYLDSLTGQGGAPSEITISYKATVNANVVTGAAGNANTAKLSYGNDPQHLTETTPDTPKVYVAEIDVNKYEGDDKDAAGKKLDGVKFVLKNASGQYYKLDNGKVTWTTVAENDSIEAYKVATADGGKIEFKGLADGTYTLVETDPLPGYNNIPGQTVTIVKGTYTNVNLKQVADVQNKSGSELPETGGMGTTIFYIIGTALVLGAGVVLITRRRMG